MKNKDLPAMPFEGGANNGIQPSSGMTKREYFAANAPDMPDWYRIQNRNKSLEPKDVLSDTELADYDEYRRDNYGYERFHEGEKASARYQEEWFKHDCKESMRVFTEWRWHYADMMLANESGES